MLSRFLDWVFPSRVEKRRRKAIEDKMREDRIKAALDRERNRQIERNARRDRQWASARADAVGKSKFNTMNSPYRTSTAEDVEAARRRRNAEDAAMRRRLEEEEAEREAAFRRREEQATASTDSWPFPTFSDSTPKEPESFAGKGGTFDGGGASGDWQDDSASRSTDCAAPSYTPSDSGSSYSGSSDSGSSCDSSSSSDSGGSCGGCD